MYGIFNSLILLFEPNLKGSGDVSNYLVGVAKIKSSDNGGGRGIPTIRKRAVQVRGRGIAVTRHQGGEGEAVVRDTGIVRRFLANRDTLLSQDLRRQIIDIDNELAALDEANDE